MRQRRQPVALSHGGLRPSSVARRSERTSLSLSRELDTRWRPVSSAYGRRGGVWSCWGGASTSRSGPGRFSWRSVGLARANAHSGLKPDSPEGRTHDLLRSPARGQPFERSRIPCKQPCSSSRIHGAFAAGPVSVRHDANAPADCAHEKDLQMQAFSRAAEGIRTLDLLHGKQTL